MGLGHYVLVIVGLLVLSPLLFFAAAMVPQSNRPFRLRLQFRLRTLLLMTAACSVGTAWYVWNYAPARRVPYLLQDLASRQSLGFDLIPMLFRRPFEEVEAELHGMGSSAVPALMHALQSPDDEIRHYATRSLARLEDPRTVAPLITALSDENWEVRYHAVNALGAIGDRRAFEHLFRMMDDPALDVRISAIEAIGRFRDSRAMQPLIDKLQGSDADWGRTLAARELGHLGDSRAIPALSEAVSDSSWRVSEAAETSLVLLRQRPVEPR